MINLESFPFVSVIIPVFNDVDCLSTCIKALQKQTYPRKYIEILVVDNGSDSDSDLSFLNFVDEQIFLFREHRPGSYAARNLGIKQARGTIIAFTDADCIPNEDWIEKGINRLLNIQNCGLVGGKILIFYDGKNEPNSIEIYEKKFSFQQKKYIEKGKFSVTANLFVFKEIFESVGLFNDQLISSGDKEWGRRVYRAGYKLVYAEEICVLHPARRSMASLRKKMLRVACGLYQLSQIEEYKQRNRIRSKLKRFIQVFIDISRTAEISFQAFASSDIESFQKRFSVAFLAWYTRYLRVSEALRLELGFPPRVTR